MNVIFVADREVETTIESCFEFAHENLNLEQLKAIFYELLSCYGACYIRNLWDCWTVVKNDGYYYLFDPLGIEVHLKKTTINRATLYRFDCLVTLLEEFLKIIKKHDGSKIEIAGIMAKIRNSQEHPKVKSNVIKKPVCQQASQKASPIMPVPDSPEKCESDSQICCEVFECP